MFTLLPAVEEPTGLRSGLSLVWISLEKEILFLLHKEISQRSWVHPVSYSIVIGVLFPGSKRPERGVNHSLSSNTKVKNEWSYTSTSPICINGVDKEISNFIHFISSWVVGVYFIFLYFAWYWASIAVWMRSAPFWDVTKLGPSRCAEKSV
jgi:hypothetical protein